MASIVGKKRGNQTYYYLVESARVDGKPRIVAQEYLGSAQEVMDRLSGAAPGRPERTQHKAFGDLAAVWGILDRLGVAGAIDEVCGSRRSDAGASVGTYLALATANRVVAPCSKLGFEQWWATTTGPRFTKVPVAVTDHGVCCSHRTVTQEGRISPEEEGSLCRSTVSSLRSTATKRC